MKFPVWTLLLISVCGISASAAETGKTLDQLMSQWLDIESQKGVVQSEWSMRKAELERRLSLMNTEQDSLKDVIAQGSKATGDVDARRLSLLQTQDTLEQEQTLVDTQIQSAITAVQSLKIKLPPPLQQEWEEKLPFLSQKGVSNSEKLERLLSLFKLAEEFNNRIALHRTTVNLPAPDNQTHNVLVTQIYLGTSQGWYISDDGATYGYGRATALGWNWWHNQEASAELGRELHPKTLLQLRAILENPTTASFISLPIKI